MATEKAYITPFILPATGIILDKSPESLKLLNLRPGLCLLKQKSEMLNTCRIGRKVIVEQ